MAIYKPKNSSNWHYRFTSQARIHTGSCFTANKANAVKFEAIQKEKAYARQFLNAPGDKDHITVKKAIERYFSDNSHRKIPKTYVVMQTKTLGMKINNRNGEKLKVFGLEANMLVHELRERDIQNLITGRFREKNTAATIIYELVFISQVLKHVKRLGYIGPVIDFAELKKANKLRQSKGRLRYLNATEEAGLISALKEDLTNDTAVTRVQRADMLDFVILLLDLGCRHGELAALRWEDVNLENKTIRLYRPKVRNESILAMSNRAFDTLIGRCKGKANQEEYVFPGLRGGHKTGGRTCFQGACKRAGIKGVSFHTLRHTFASKLVQAEISLYDVQQLLGHADATTTQRYAHLAPSQSAQRAQTVLNAING